MPRCCMISFEDLCDTRRLARPRSVIARKPVAISVMTPVWTEWWLRPDSSAARVGEHNAVV
jgi:hypothetical protein